MSIIKSIREEKGYTQNDLASKTGLSLRTIQRLESSNKVPKGYSLTTLAEEFGMDATALQSKFVQVQRSKESEITTLKVINFSVLSFLGVPFGNVIFPIVLWRNNRDSEFVDAIARQIVNFQILFTLSLNLLLILTPFTLSKLFPGTPLLLMIFIFAYLINIAIVFRTAYQIKQQKFDFLQLPIRLV